MATKAIDIGERIRSGRKAKGLTQADLAKRIGLKYPPPIIEWEKNRRRPNSNSRRKLASALDISFERTRRPSHKETNAARNVDIGRLIRRARKQKELTQTALGAQLRPRKTQGAIASWEKNGPPKDEDLLDQLERILGTRLNSSFDNKEDQDQPELARNTRNLSETEEEIKEEVEPVNSHTVFKILGPIPIPGQHKGGGWALFDDKKAQNQFWGKDQLLRRLKNGRGVYIYAIETSNGITPIYVGKATKGGGFSQECFTHSNQRKYLNGLAKYREGTTVMFFIVRQSKRGQPNLKAVNEIEVRLIQLAEIKNPDLKNDHHRFSKKWSIQGIIGSRREPQTNDSRVLRKALGLAEEAEDMPQ